jgi:hypothetical protein
MMLITEMRESKSGQNAPDSPWEDLVVSILSVNQYSLEYTYLALTGLREQRLTDPVSLSGFEPGEIEARLRASGCDRGSFMTSLFAERLAALGQLIRSNAINECEKVIGSNDVRAIEALLLPVRGIGPAVLRNFYLLRNIRK